MTPCSFIISDIIKENDNDIEFASLFQRLTDEEFPDLPPGGGIHAKYEIFFSLNRFDKFSVTFCIPGEFCSKRRTIRFYPAGSTHR